jgi:hypothetical protein
MLLKFEIPLSAQDIQVLSPIYWWSEESSININIIISGTMTIKEIRNEWSCSMKRHDSDDVFHSKMHESGWGNPYTNIECNLHKHKTHDDLENDVMHTWTRQEHEWDIYKLILKIIYYLSP